MVESAVRDWVHTQLDGLRQQWSPPQFTPQPYDAPTDTREHQRHPPPRSLPTVVRHRKRPPMRRERTPFFSHFDLASNRKRRGSLPQPKTKVVKNVVIPCRPRPLSVSAVNRTVTEGNSSSPEMRHDEPENIATNEEARTAVNGTTEDVDPYPMLP